MNLFLKFKSLSFALLLIVALNSFGQSDADKQIQYLSGTDVTHPKTWDFFCTGGRKSGEWTTIQVPSNWEQQGFGTYNFGRDNVNYGKNFHFFDEKGLYKMNFTIPKEWKEKDVFIVFEGSMTDTEVKVNGKLAGTVHQGAFYRFKYNINDKLKFGSQNLLEVTVSKMSSDNSVNGAERLADYWIFGGIYRPVYLEAVPKENIAWTAIDAKADGTFNINVHLNKVVVDREIVTEIIDAKGKIIANNVAKTGNDSIVNIKTKVVKPLLWTSETPNLYQVKIYLKKGSTVIYKTEDKFGFRTIEVRALDGIYVNGTKVKMKGVNRHVLWPEYGRATYPEADLLDVQLIKGMNMNAVRCSHYPPDKNFLSVCDSLGLYVINELAGWQKAYSTKAGTPLVKEMVIRDANHPSVIFWSNGNEGGHNFDFDDDFGKYDLSNRTVIHAHHKPGNAINGIDCNHYEGYESTKELVGENSGNIHMPTEFLHAMHDGGGAAALADYWELQWNGKHGGGGFIWSFADEGIMRTDLNNMIDVNANNAADGLVGPHRQKESSYNAVKEIYSPVRITLQELPADFKGTIPVENRYHFTNLKNCNFQYELINFRNNNDSQSGYIINKQGKIASPDIAPTVSGNLKLNLPESWNQNDALAVTAYDPEKNEIYRWVWKIKTHKLLLTKLLAQTSTTKVDVKETESRLTIKGGDISVSFDKKTGMIQKLENDKSPNLSFNNGPVLVSGNSAITGVKHFKEGENYIVEFSYSGNLSYVRWKMQPSGWLEMQYSYTLNGKFPFAGVSFNYPQGLVNSVKWLGKGPGRVWKNRIQGVTADVYQNMNNNTETGSAPWIYPEFKGYYADIVWMEMSTQQGKIMIASPDKDLYVRLFDFYGVNADIKTPLLPTGNISFLDAIPPVGSKMAVNDSGVSGFGPSSELNTINEAKERTIYFFFGTPKSLSVEN
ncbi:glycoside hydrolase family 2 protein [Flavobacterium pectinovorum]|uniref:glycoside hydrolase family 2 protein n=1 Tax=Flavobacterium pectinovorum TaxID=29533 RepID=UPI001FACD3F7|nr:glycoside hydrolase family 2 TIM barrel-domain containing protein [Flavobacterium pectinovorum]MCI9845998.1 glycoside hydrolase family 2 [Flavobacterium pectinovorum]